MQMGQGAHFQYWNPTLPVPLILWVCHPYITLRIFFLPNYKIFYLNNKTSISKGFSLEADQKSQINQIQVLQLYIQNLRPLELFGS